MSFFASSNAVQWSPTAWYNPLDVVQYGAFNYACQTQNQGTPPYPTTPVWLIINPGGGGGLTNPLTTNLDLGANDIINTNDTQTTTIGVDVINLRTGSLAPRITVSQGMDITSITSTTFTTAPQTNAVPTVGDDLCNKTYVDSVAGGGGVQNPLTADLLAAGYSIQNAGTVQTNFLTLPSIGANPTLEISSPLSITNPTLPAQFTLPPQTSTAPTVGNDLANKTYVDGAVSGYVQNPMTANLQSGNYDVQMAEGSITFSHPTTAPADYSINGVYNIDAGTLPYPVMRFSSSKAAGTQQKSLTLTMGDGEAIWTSAWEGNIPQTIRTKQSAYRIEGQGAGAQTVIQSDILTIGPSVGSATAGTYNGTLAFTGGASATNPPVVGNDLTNKTYVDGRTQRPTNVYYVAKNGNDSTGDGSIGKPYLTIQAAITAAETGALPSAANQAVIFVGPGTYVESPTLTDGYTTICGASSNNRNYNTKISGTITVSATGANDLYNRIFSFENLLVAGVGAGTPLQDTTVATEHTVIATNCRFITNDRAFYQNAGGNTRNVFLNCYFGHENASALYTNPLIEMAGASWLDATQCEFYSQNTQADVIRFSGTSYPYRLGLCQITSASTSATANPLVRYSSTQTGVGSVGQCSFVYESPVVKNANSPPSTGWLFDTGAFVYPAATPVVNFIQNAFVLNGLTLTTLPVIAKSSTTTGVPIVLSGNQISAPTLAQKIQGGGAIVHQQYNTVN